MPDGVYVTGEDGRPSFVRAPQLTDDDVQQIVETTAKPVGVEVRSWNLLRFRAGASVAADGGRLAVSST
tara:strand:+ start:621 stop:827 length:207 start_codon:yes stop_codon:yes gene_type:complete